MSIKLPISKSIANRLLLLQAIHGDPLMRVSSDMPDDVIVLHDALARLREYKKGEPLTLYLKNCGTALRFLQVHLAKCYPGEPITLTGDPRLMERDGKPTTQTTSARILHGENIPVDPDESPYITMSRRLASLYHSPAASPSAVSPSAASLYRPTLVDHIEPDWSAAAFWYEYVAIHGGELLLEGLTSDSLQGDRIVADIYAQYFAVQTTFTPDGAVIRSVSPKDGLSAQRSNSETVCHTQSVSLNFSNCPDLYPAVALTCEKLSIDLIASGTDRLRYKESDRLEAVRLHEVRNDHRMAMALMAADYIHPLPASTPEDEAVVQCIAKSYPEFVSVYTATRRQKDGNETATTYNVTTLSISHVTPIRGVNDDNLGKKHALSKLIHAATSEYLWLHDDDVVLPPAVNLQSTIYNLQSDLIILPLRMESLSDKPSLLERLQIAEYAAIQELTMRTAKRSKAVMCSGANMIVRREVWLECEKDLHPEIPSGDDMFLLEAVKRRGYKIGVIDDPAYTAIVRPLTSWKAFFRQRMRWAGKAPHYTDRDIIRCGRLVALANILQILCPLIILIKFPIEFSYIKKREPRTPWYVALLLELLYPFYLLFCLIGGLFRMEW